ncbi:MAG TPA: chemotaxis response regulator protein-glutamate methylesterase [Verrucomicrobiae bacterium]
MRIAIVNDMLLAVEALRRVLTASGRHTVAWVAVNGAEAVEKCRNDRPDLILMDLMMPVMGGVEATRLIMQNSPCAILLVTASVDSHVSQVFQGLGVGALDAVNTPALFDAGKSMESQALLYKVDMLAKQLLARGYQPPVSTLPMAPPAPKPVAGIVVIGASAGGPAALATVLGQLPSDLPAGVVIVQHVDEQFTSSMASWLSTQSRLPVRLAQEGESPVPGVALLAGKSQHLVFSSGQNLLYTEHPATAIYRPSIDVFFNSVCDHWSRRVVGVVLTGMGSDGAKGLKRLRETGAHTIAQDQATSAVYGMPKAAAALGAAVDILPLDGIAPAIERQVRRWAANPNF